MLTAWLTYIENGDCRKTAMWMCYQAAVGDTDVIIC